MRTFFLGCVAVALACAQVACVENAEEPTASGTASAFTVEHGDVFVESATPERIVLKKKVGGIAFPFDETTLKGKALLIHVIAGKASEGVYARALGVRTENETYVVDAQPLSFDEMGRLQESDIVRIYVDALRASRRRRAGAIGPASLQIQSGSDVDDVSGFNFTQTPKFLSPVKLGGGVTVDIDIQEAGFSADTLVDWSAENGLDLGFRGELRWKSKIEIGGRLVGEFFRSEELETPPILAYVPIGPVPVPVTLKGRAFIRCAAVGTTPVRGAVTLTASASLGGSVRIAPDIDTPPGTWVKEGPWPWTATGTADATATLETNVSSTVWCALPRIELHASVAGVAGPYVAVAPRIVLPVGGASRFDTIFSAGVSAGMPGFSGGFETVVYAWTP